MNLVASAILRGMVGASSSADLSGVPGKRAKARADALDHAAGTSGESLRAVFYSGEDARAALKGIEAEAGLMEKEGQGAQGWGFFRSIFTGADAVHISGAGKSSPGALGATPAAQEKSASTGSRLTIKA